MTTIKLKNGSGAPLAGDLVQGEPALDLTNKRLYTEDSGGTVIEVGTNPSELTVDTDTLVVDSANNRVGVGTASPFAKFDIANGSEGSFEFTPNAASVNGGVIEYLNRTTGTSRPDLNLYASDATAKIKLYTAAQERLVVDSSGNVGIGTSGPAPAVATGVGIEIGNTSGSFLRLRETGAANSDWEIFTPNADNTLYFRHVNTSLDMMQFNSGTSVSFGTNVGIGTSSPNATLTVDRGATSGLIATFQGDNAGGARGLEITSKDNGGTTGAILDFNAKSSSSNAGLTYSVAGAERMRIDSSGNLLVGTTSNPTSGTAGFKVSNPDSSTPIIGVSGTTSKFMLAFHNANGNVGYISTINNSTAYVTSSDVRLKENITDAPAGNIDALKVRSFDWKADGSHQEYGFVAQELDEVAPYAVSKGETEDDMWGVDYSKLVPMLVKEIQDLKAEVAALKGA